MRLVRGGGILRENIRELSVIRRTHEVLDKNPNLF